jgi:hypothetical protein
MKPNKISTTRILLSVSLVAFALAWTGCEKDYNYVTPPDTSAPPVIITTPVLYSAEIQPIFTAKCANTGCHDGASVAPDLRAGSSYAALNDMALINTASPSSSELYRRVTLASSNPEFMPEGGTALTSEQTGKILSWITQGALNN